MGDYGGWLFNSGFPMNTKKPHPVSCDYTVNILTDHLLEVMCVCEWKAHMVLPNEHPVSGMPGPMIAHLASVMTHQHSHIVSSMVERIN